MTNASQTAPAAVAGTQLTTVVSCPAGKVVLGGGGSVTTNGGATQVAMQSSWPSSTTQWSVTGVVLSNLAAGRRMTVDAFVLCSL